MDKKNDQKPSLQKESSNFKNKKEIISPLKKKDLQKIKMQQIVNKAQTTESTQNSTIKLDSQSPIRTNQIQIAQNQKKSLQKVDMLKKHIKDQIGNLEEQKGQLIASDTSSLLGNRFQICDELVGMGTFGYTHIGIDLKRNRKVAIKIMLKKGSLDSFILEATVMRSLNYIRAIGFPQLIMSAYNENICVLVMDLLGENLETIRRKYQQLSLAVVCSIGIQMINRLESIHQTGFVHRDIKPQNIIMGKKDSDNQNKVYLIDFGLSTQYLDEQGNHIQQTDEEYNQVVGTALFASIRAHKGQQLSRRDDVESFFYTLLYLLLGNLPWRNINVKNKKERHQIIQYMKDELAKNKCVQQALEGIPSKFFEILEYSQKLEFNSEPDYKFIKGILQKIIKEQYSIKKIADIDIQNNNYEQNEPVQQEQELVRAEIDISCIAFQIDDNPKLSGMINNNMNTNQNSELINEHLAKSEVDGKSMNTQELKEEMAKQFNPQNLKQIIYGKMKDINNSFGQIKEEDEEDDEDQSIEPNMKKNPGLILKISSKKINQEDDDDLDDIPDDENEYSHINNAYFQESKDNHLQQISFKQQ